MIIGKTRLGSTCVDCGKQITRTAKRCKQCRGKTMCEENNPMFGVHRFGEKSPGYKNGQPKCKDCGII